MSTKTKELKDCNLTENDINMVVAFYNRYNTGDAPLATIADYNYITSKECLRVLKKFTKDKNASVTYKEQANNIINKIK